MPETIRLLTATMLTLLALACLFGLASCATHRCHDLPADRYVTLLAADGELVARIAPDERLKNGTPWFPDVIEFQGKKYERCTTQQYNTDAQERLWCEVK